MPDGVHFLNLRDEPEARRSDLTRAFYEDVYRDAFPKLDQTESPDIWLPLMRAGVAEHQPYLHIVLACDENERVLGGVIFEQYRLSGCWLVTYIAVRPNARHHGIATRLMSAAVHTIRQHQSRDWILFAETENPQQIDDPTDRDHANERLHILARLQMRRIPIAYVQPALSPGLHELNNLFLLCYVPDPGVSQIPAARVMAFLHEFYAAFELADAPYLSEVGVSLAGKEFVGLEPLVPASEASPG